MAAAALALALAARAQVLTNALLSLQFPFFDAGGGGGTLSGGTLGLVHSIGQNAVVPMSGGTLTLTPGLIGLQPAAAADDSFVHAFPVPFKPSLGEDRITFRGLTTNATVRIYTVTGQLIQTLTKNDPATRDLVWLPVTDSAGRTVASGVYFYTVNGDGGRASGKLMIIR
jgi:hypothetical protein